MAKKWRNKTKRILFGEGGAIAAVFYPGEVFACPESINGCKFEIFTGLPTKEMDRRIKEAMQ